MESKDILTIVISSLALIVSIISIFIVMYTTKWKFFWEKYLLISGADEDLTNVIEAIEQDAIQKDKKFQEKEIIIKKLDYYLGLIESILIVYKYKWLHRKVYKLLDLHIQLIKSNQYVTNHIEAFQKNTIINPRYQNLYKEIR